MPALSDDEHVCMTATNHYQAPYKVHGVRSLVPKCCSHIPPVFDCFQYSYWKQSNTGGGNGLGTRLCVRKCYQDGCKYIVHAIPRTADCTSVQKFVYCVLRICGNCVLQVSRSRKVPATSRRQRVPGRACCFREATPTGSSCR